MSETHTKTGEGVLVDVVRESPVDRYLLRFRRKVLWIVLVIVLLLVAWCLVRDRADGSQDGGGASSGSGYSAAAAVAAPDEGGA